MSKGLNSFTKQGYADALRGHTACPYGVEKQVHLWNRGYDIADKEDKSLYPRFAGRKRKKK